jgi:dihydroorotate dehydrogenase
VSGGIYRLLRQPLFALDPERAHRGALAMAALAERVAGRLASGGGPARWPHLRQTLLGLEFPNPIGLAAGFDKDGVAPHLWARLGFGFAEIGTVTASPQPGNPRPRLFRLAADRAVVNRLGFNSAGADAVAARLRRRLARRPPIPIGLNVGCSRSAMGDPDREIADYRHSVRALAPLADYLAVNVSSPNTPGLRDLQAPERLGRLLVAIRESLAGIGRLHLPVLVKLSPDLADDAIPEVCSAALSSGADGFIASNTTLSRVDCTSPLAGEGGGLSGAPLRARATEMVRSVRSAVGSKPPIIGVGGVASVGDVLEKLEAGANLVALYTGLIYEGPGLPARLAGCLERELAERGTALAASGAERPARLAVRDR